MKKGKDSFPYAIVVEVFLASVYYVLCRLCDIRVKVLLPDPERLSVTSTLSGITVVEMGEESEDIRFWIVSP